MSMMVMGLLGLALSAAGTAVSVSEQKKATKLQARGLRAQQRSSDIEAARERAKTIREGRIKRAAMIQAGVTTGTTGSSGVHQGTGSISVQTGTGVSYVNQQQQIGHLATNLFASGAGAATKAATAGAVSNVGSSIFTQGYGGYSKLFSDMGIK